MKYSCYTLSSTQLVGVGSLHVVESWWSESSSEATVLLYSGTYWEESNISRVFGKKGFFWLENLSNQRTRRNRLELDIRISFTSWDHCLVVIFIYSVGTRGNNGGVQADVGMIVVQVLTDPSWFHAFLWAPARKINEGRTTSGVEPKHGSGSMEVWK